MRQLPPQTPHAYLIGDILNTPKFLQKDIEKVEEKMRAQANKRHPNLRVALENLLEAGGKRVRPRLVLLTGNMFGANEEQLITLAAAIEMLHTATLVHDDLIDGSLMRRGNETINAHWTPAATVLTGDFVFARAAKLAANTGNLALMDLFAETLAVIVNGELTQMFDSRGLISRDNYIQRIYAKTASLIETCTQGATMLCPVEDKTILAMKEFGYNLGMAFQIMDDILDFTGKEDAVGKPLGSDLLQGLVTLPTIYYIEKFPNSPYIKVLLNGNYQDTEKIKKLIDEIRHSEAPCMAHDEAKTFVQKALAILTAFPISKERTSLEEMSRYIISRDI